ncbi:hypothetical protein M0D21_15960 [Aquimarina sp. D1M17]|uniref:hypothetical protein n=1 Tax=Aquimarina acroporae TaxID=2937283 RepID=UPI0020C0319F|nr:hypothetical protein [Aquimarina acroporae]MCK8523073.1 hypothetical protein [Aquimarina acroporae]
MALPTSGKICIGDILREMGRPTNTKTDLNSLASQWYNQTRKAKFNNTKHKLSDWYGETWSTVTLSISPTRYNGNYQAASVRITVTTNSAWSVHNLIGSGGSIPVGEGQGFGNGSFTIRFGSNPYTSTRVGEYEVRTEGLPVYSASFNWSQTGRSGGGGGGPIEDPIDACFDLKSVVQLANGKTKLLEEIVEGDILVGLDFPDRIDASEGDYMQWIGNIKDAKPTKVKVKKLATYVEKSYYHITLKNKSVVKVTPGHSLLTTDNDKENKVCWKKPPQIKKGDFMVDKSGKLIEIRSITHMKKEIEVGVLDVESVDNYVISGIVAHNAEILSTELVDTPIK